MRAGCECSSCAQGGRSCTDGARDSASISRPPPILEASEQPEKAKPVEAAREQKITPFDVAGEVDAAGKDLGM